jgi:hypothetical protein
VLIGPAERRESCARFLAESLLSTVGTRLQHTRTAVGHATDARALIDEPWRSALVPAMWLHDIGYHPALVQSGFHPLDGARFLQASGWAAEICQLVAWHTAAGIEAQLRGVLPQLRNFPQPPLLAVEALAWADLTSSPSGERVGAGQRLAEILVRYPEGSVVHRSVTAARSDLLEAARRVESRLTLIRGRG